MASRIASSRVAIVVLTVLTATGLIVSPVAGAPATEAMTSSPAISANDAPAPPSPSVPDYTDDPVNVSESPTGLSPFGSSTLPTRRAQFGQRASHAPFGAAASTSSFARDSDKDTPNLSASKESYDPAADDANETDSSSNNSTQHNHQAGADDDEYEPNDRPENATQLSSGTQLTAQIAEDHLDYYAIEASSGDEVSASINFDHDTADVDLFLLNPSLTTIDQSISTTDDESVAATGSSSGTYYVLVYGFNNGPADYTLTADVAAGDSTTPDSDEYEPNDRPGDATQISSGTQLSAQIDENLLDYYAIDASGGDEISASIDFDHDVADIDLFLLSPSQNTLDQSISTTDGESVSAVAPESGTHYIVVYGYSGGPADYTLTANVTATESSISPDRLEPNDAPDTATPVEPGRIDNLTLSQTDIDAFALDLTEGDSLEAEFFPGTDWDSGDAANVAIFYQTSDGAVEALAERPAAQTPVSVSSVQRSGTYFVVVSSQDSTGGYSLSLSTTAGSGGDLSADRFEPNDAPNTSVPTEPGTISNLTLPAGDIDAFNLQLSAGDSLQAQVSPETSLDADEPIRVDIFYQSEPGAPVEFITGQPVQEGAISVQNVDRDGIYHVVVFNDGADGIRYDLSVSTNVSDGGGGTLDPDRFEPNDAPDTAAPVDPGTLSNLTLATGDIDAFAVELAAGDSIEAEVQPTEALDSDDAVFTGIYYDTGGGAVDNIAGSPVRDGPVRAENVERSGTYYVAVFNDGADGIRYNLSISTTAGNGTGGALADDRFEPNDAPSSSTPIEPGRLSDLTLPSEDIDAFNLQLSAGDSLEAEVFPETTLSSDAAATVEIYYQSEPGAGVEFLTGNPIQNGSVTVADVERDGIYHVVVFNSGADGIRYDLAVNTSIAGDTGGNDRLEPNDAPETAVPIEPRTLEGLTIESGDLDAFTVELSAGQGLSTTMFPADTLSTTDNVRLQYFYQSNSTANVTGPIAETVVTGSNTTLSQQAVRQDGIYHIVVDGGSLSQPVDYDLAVNTSGESSGGGGGSLSEGVSIELAPGTQSVGPNNTVTYDVVVTNVTNGLGAYEFVVETSDSSVATITSVTPRGVTSNSLISTNVTSDGSSATVVASNTNTANGTVTAMTITVSGESPGTAGLDLRLREGNRPADEVGNPYTVAQVSDASVNVTESGAGPGDLTGDGNAATDPDGDGVYEDINGDGSVTAADVTALFDLLVGGGLPEDTSTLDINGQGDGATAADVTAMFNALLNGQIP